MRAEEWRGETEADHGGRLQKHRNGLIDRNHLRNDRHRFQVDGKCPQNLCAEIRAVER